MDFRTALPIGYELCVQDQSGGILRYIIQREIGRGGSCIVYDAIHRLNTGAEKHIRIKECYPFKLKIARSPDQTLQVEPADAEAFAACIRKMKDDCNMIQRLFEESLSDSVTELWDIYKANQTIYSVFAFSSEKTLSSDLPKTLKTCFEIARKIAYVIGKIHEYGFLYLDLKPDNILIEHGQSNRVLFCDFDSLFPIQAKNAEEIPGNFRLSYSPSYAPIELITLQKKQIGPQTDIYSIGVLLFQLLFDRVPTILDCMQNAMYDYSEMKPEYKGTYRDRLFFALTDFFRKTLASFYKNRYSNMQETEQALHELEKLADIETPFICSTKIIPPAHLFARESELSELNDWLTKTHNPCLCVTGLGGIGKSVLVQKFLCDCRGRMDSVLYLPYHGSLKETISDDFFAKINTVEKNPSESDDQYFTRKKKAFKDCVGEQSVLVIDNFVWNESDDLMRLFEIGWRVILISREKSPIKQFQEIRISALPEEGQQNLFESNLGRSLNKTELSLFRKIAEKVSGHTFVLELIAKQIAASYLSLEQSVELIDQKSFSQMAPESVNYAKDGKIHQSRMVADIIAELFDTARLSEEEHALLKVVSLFGIPVEMTFLQEAMNMQSKDTFHQMNRTGFLELQDQFVSLHPVIREAVRNWKWTEKSTENICSMLLWLDTFFFIDLPKQYMDKAELDRLKREKHHLIKSDAFGKMLWKIHEKSYLGRRYLREVLYCDTPSSSDIQKCDSILMYTENMLRNSDAIEIFGKLESFLELDHYVTIRRHGKDIQQLERLLEKPYYKRIHLIQILLRIIPLYAESGSRKKAQALLKRTKKECKKVHDWTIWGNFYYCCGECFIISCEGTESIEDKEKCKRMAEKTVNKALRYFRKGKDRGRLYLALCDWYFYVIGEAFSNEQKKDEIIKRTRKLFEEIERTKKTLAFPLPDVEIQYLRSRILFHAALGEETDSIGKDAIKLRELLNHSTISDGVKAEKYYLWIAMSFFKIGSTEESKKWIMEGIAICDANKDEVLFSEIKNRFTELLLKINEEAIICNENGKII